MTVTPDVLVFGVELWNGSGAPIAFNLPQSALSKSTRGADWSGSYLSHMTTWSPVNHTPRS